VVLLVATVKNSIARGKVVAAGAPFATDTSNVSFIFLLIHIPVDIFVDS